MAHPPNLTPLAPTAPPTAPPPTSGRAGRPLQRRGFVLLVVVILLGALTAAVMVKYDASVQELNSSQRMVESVQARAIADTCLDRAVRYARSIVTTGTATAADFDLLLDPDGNIQGGNDEFIPAGGTTVYVPNDGANDPFARYALFTGAAYVGGGCLIRFDDNKDDELVGLAASTSNNPDNAPTAGAGDEGPGTGDNPYRDRDLSIVITAIGLFPVRVADGTAYDKAHARVTVRGYLDIQTSSTASALVPAIHAGGSISVGGFGAKDNAVCGAGGAIFNGGAGSDICGCGQVASPLDGTSCVSTGDCGSFDGILPCAPPVATAFAAPVIPNHGTVPETHVHIKTTADYEGWIPADAFKRASGADALNDDPDFGTFDGVLGGAGGVCTYYFLERHNTAAATANRTFANNQARVFVWDDFDVNPYAYVAGTTDKGLGRYAVNINGAPTGTVHPSVLIQNFTTGGLAHDCSNYVPVGGQVGMPCDWEWEKSVPGKWDVTCGAWQTACWKPVAVMDGLEGGGGQTPGFDAWESTKGTTSTSETFQPKANEPIPFIFDSPGADTWSARCGGGGNNTQDDRGWRFQYGGFPSVSWWQTNKDIDAADWPGGGGVWVFDNSGSFDERVYAIDHLGQNNTPLSAAIIARGAVNLASNRRAALCCPSCTCTGYPLPSLKLTSSPPAGAELWDRGYVVHAGNHCRITDDKRLVGDILCKTVMLGDDNRIVGDLWGVQKCNNYGSGCDMGFFQQYALFRSGSCRSFTANDDPGVCMSRDNEILGKIFANGDLTIDRDNSIVDRMPILNDATPGPQTMWDVGTLNVAEDLETYRKNDVVGRAIVFNLVRMYKDNRYYSEANGTVSTVVTDETLWSETTW